MVSRSRQNYTISIQSVVLLCLFLATLNFVNRYYYCVFIAFGLFCIGIQGRFRMEASAIVPLLLLAVSWAFFSTYSLADSVFNVIKPFTYMLCYIMGFNMMGSKGSPEETNYKKFYLFMCVIAAGSLVHYLLNWLMNLSSGDRNTVDFWVRTEVAATGQAALACLPLSLALAGIFCRNNWKIKAASYAVLLIVIGYNLILSGRTLFALMLIVGFAAFSHQFLQEKNNKARMLVGMLVVVALIAVIYMTDTFGIKTYIKQSPFYDRFFGTYGKDLDEDNRIDKKLFYLKNMLKYPLGGGKLYELKGYAHDIYLDTYGEAGVFGMVAVVVYIVRSVICGFKFIFDKKLPFALRQTVFCLLVLLNIEFWVEPILQGMPWLFASYCFIDGCVCRILRDKKLKIGGHHENH